ncbi:MAG: CRTAC1 family protein [Verrucomicrobiales bacterium]|nr:CRTAC1 family protein [Verrucomicrobiales bacterium]MED5586924.1 CRTAC1 family protein [Verrucomicrobiota bacterium]
MPLGNSGSSPGLVRSNPAQDLIESVRRGSSFSGNERHVVYQNNKGNGFSDISGVSGLDLPDDGRAACFTDWDNDGDLDLWVNNRNAPQIRFFRNNNPAKMQGLTVKLVGKSCSLDAIGARVILYLKGQKPQTKSVTAGSGFLAQSSKTLHFGLQENIPIEKLVIHWPGSKMETHAGISAGSYVIAQGEPPRALTLKDPAPGKAPAPAEHGAGRTFLSQRLPVKTVFPTPVGTTREPSLVVLASEDCQQCKSQLGKWQESPPEGLIPSVHYMEKLQEERPILLQLARLVHDHFFYITDRSLQTPLSFLIDTEGRLCAIYRGQVNDAILKKDVASLKIQGEELRLASLPFPGQWQSGTVPRAEPLAFVEELLDAGLLGPARLYINEYRPLLEPDEFFPQLLARLQSMENR